MGTGRSSGGQGGRGQSSPIAMVLVFGLVIGATTVVLLVGGLAITDAQDQLDAASAEKAMTQFDSQASLVALGQSRSQTVELGSTGSASYEVSDSAGSMAVTYENATTGNETTLMDADMGAVVYEREDGARVVYQGGGVWRSDGNGSSTMVSPPEFHYRDGTLTLPLVTVSNDASISGDAVIRDDGRTREYPNETLANPLTGGSISITIQSQYHAGWYRYLDSRTQGTVTHDPANERVEMTLTVPIRAEFENSVATVAEDGISNETAFQEPFEEGVSAPVPDSRINTKIADCEEKECKDLSTHTANGTLKPGTYYANSSTSLGDLTYQTNGKDIEVVVNGSLSNSNGNADQDITGGGNVTWYVKGDVTLSGTPRINTGGDPNDLLVMVHSTGDSFSGGTAQLTGLIYAPGSDFNVSGGGTCGRSGGTSSGNPCEANIVGSIVTNTADGGGNGDVNHAGSITRELDFTTASAITYLHVSENRITVTD